MKPVYANLVQLDLAFYEIYQEGYNPLKNIKDFWSTYAIDTCKNYIAALMENSLTHAKVSDTIKQDGEKDFFGALIRLLIAYFMIHFQNLDMNWAEISFSESRERIQEDLDTKKRIYDFFSSISKESNQ
ncbi:MULTISPECIES: hypothetical protein [Sphingobacterium]|uniref:hypothetical protein n=1 Tax=Sphingobacterium TaxID=28453 RepID=UPI000E955157|nr:MULTISPECIES: hypothetical protein [Sphingobacterium]HAU55822.1 hypothetical protein [Sphingobacterium sp.]